MVLSIIDTGCGMDEATLLRAVEPFFTTKDIGAGSGLGLAMVHGFAAQSGGAIALRSTPGEGTTAEIWLPRAGTAPSEERTTSQTIAGMPDGARPHRGGQILVCDDDPGVRAMVSEVLRQIGYQVQVADGSASARRILASGAALDLLVADYAMPGMNGLELIDTARQMRPELKAMLVTGHADMLQRTGADGVPILLKPFKPAELAQRVALLLTG